ncbi:MAG: DMT family transporter [Clostridia bacterium]|nr:DMT family transporter [Clostridia bacterium]
MEKKKGQPVGHLMAAIAICVWGSTFIFSKIMLRDFTPLQIMTMRFVVAYIVLWCLYPKVEKTTFKDNLGIFVLSLFGNTIYFLFENNALQYTLAANVSIIVASAPIWTAILAHFFSKGEKIRRNTIYGSALAFAGVALVVFNGTIVLKFNPLGDILSLGAALSWAVYSILVVKYVNRFSSFFLMRRATLCAMIASVPMLIISGQMDMPFECLLQKDALFSIIFLGVLGSGVSYVLWNMATRILGVIKVNAYIYVNPFVTMITAGIFLGEPVTAMGIIGAVMIIGGVVLGVTERRRAEDVEEQTEDMTAE